MHHVYTVLALDIARQRSEEADAARRAQLAVAARGTEHGIVRRGLASGLAVVARGSAAAVRRLDECTSDDLTRALTTR